MASSSHRHTNESRSWNLRMALFAAREVSQLEYMLTVLALFTGMMEHENKKTSTPTHLTFCFVLWVVDVKISALLSQSQNAKLVC